MTFSQNYEYLSKFLVEDITFSNQIATIDSETKYKLFNKIKILNGDEKLSHSGSDFSYAVVSILFSKETRYNSVEFTKNQNKTFDNFFNNLFPKWEDEKDLSKSLVKNRSIDFLPFFSLFDFGKKYVYKGSFTEPNCESNVFWNVLSEVYPLSDEVYHNALGSIRNLTSQIGKEYNKHEEDE